MAGTYPDVPGQKRAYDIDGTILVRKDNNGTYTTLANSVMIELNDYDATVAATVPVTNGSAQWYFSWVFPQPIVLRAFWGTIDVESVGIGSTPSLGTYYSTNTTDGTDGTWTAIFGQTGTTSLAWSTHGFQDSDATEPENRTNIKTLASPINNVKGFRVQINESNTKEVYLKTTHIYGEHYNPQYLEFWHPTLDQALDGAYFDWGNTTISTTATKTFRIKNTSATQLAHDCTMALNTLANESPSPTSWHSLSTDNSTFTSTLTLGDIAANSMTGVLYLKRTTPSNAPLQLTDLRMTVTTTGFG